MSPIYEWIRNTLQDMAYDGTLPDLIAQPFQFAGTVGAGDHFSHGWR